MNKPMHPHLRLLLQPENRGEQVEGVLRYYLSENTYDALKDDPTRLEQVAMQMFLGNDGHPPETGGYRVHIVRCALIELKSRGWIDKADRIYDDLD